MTILRAFCLAIAIYSSLILAHTSCEQTRHDSNLYDLTRLPTFASKPRIFIMSDILNEPDDEMSLVRLLLYSDQYDISGICATTSKSLPNTTHPERMVEIVRSYGKVIANLDNHVHPDFRFQSANELEALVSSGPKVYGRQALDQSLSNGAQNLVQKLEESNRPLYLGIWGGANTLAQALYHIEKTRPASQAASLRARLRIYSISDQDDTGPWIRAKWPELFYIVNVHGFQEYRTATWAGINSPDNGASNVTKVQQAWLTRNIQLGPLGSEYPNILYGMEGDTPSFLWLVQNGLNNPIRPDWGGWGGRYTRVTESTDINTYSESMDTVMGIHNSTYTSIQATVWRWRDAFQDDFAARMHWTLSSNFHDAAHPPIIIVNNSTDMSALYFRLGSNESIILDANNTIDTDDPNDNSHLDFQWFTYLEAGFPRDSNLGISFIRIEPLTSSKGSNQSYNTNDTGATRVTFGQKVKVVFQVPDHSVLQGIEWHVILQVRNDKGPHPVRRYKRFVFTSR